MIVKGIVIIGIFVGGVSRIEVCLGKWDESCLRREGG